MSDDERLARLIFEGTPALARRLIATEDLLALIQASVGLDSTVDTLKRAWCKEARAEALEEAARLCERVPGDPKHGDFFAAAIRALSE